MFILIFVEYAVAWCKFLEVQVFVHIFTEDFEKVLKYVGHQVPTWSTVKSKHIIAVRLTIKLFPCAVFLFASFENRRSAANHFVFLEYCNVPASLGEDSCR